MLFMLLSSCFILIGAIETASLQPLVKMDMEMLNTSAPDLRSVLASKTKDSVLLKVLANADPTQVGAILDLIKSLLADTELDLNTLTSAVTNSNSAYDLACKTHSASVDAQTDGLAKLAQDVADAEQALSDSQQAQTEGVAALAVDVANALGEKQEALGFKTAAQAALADDEARLVSEIDRLKQAVAVMETFGDYDTADPVIVTPTTVTVLAPTGGDGKKITGWRKASKLINFGEAGLVGGWWKQMTLEFDYGSDISVSGVKCDYTQNPYTLEVSSDGTTWSSAGTPEGMAGDHVFSSNLNLRYARVQWVKTGSSNGFHWALYQ